MNHHRPIERSARRPRLLGVGAPVVVAILGVALLLSTRSPIAHESGWVKSNEVGQVSATAETQGPAHCEGLAGIPFGTDPGWVRVGGSTDPNTPFIELRGQVFRAHVTHEDNSANHVAHDLNVYVIPDPAYRHFLADGDLDNEEPDSLGFHNHSTIENEWEYGGIPLYTWPARRDRVTAWGPLIWDCGHGGGDGPNGEDVYQTEIHPHAGWVVYRQTADADGEPDSEEKRTRDWLWYDTGDLQGIGARFPTMGGTLETTIQTTVADAFFSSWGGIAPESLNGCDSDVVDCTQDNEWLTRILQQDYTFFVPAPPKPATASVLGEPTMIWTSEDHCGEVPSNPGDPFGDDIFQMGEADGLTDPTATDIGSPTCGTIVDDVVETTDAYGMPGIQVTVLASQAVYPGNNYVAFAKRYKVSWDHVPSAAERVRRYAVHFDSVRVWRGGDSGDAEWAMGLRANEQWVFPVAGSGEDGDPFYVDSSIDDNDMDCAGDDGDCNDYSIDETLTVSVPPGNPINIWIRIVELDDPGPAVFDPNDLLPEVDVDRTGPGSYSTGLVSNDDGAYEVFYTITDVSDVPPTLGSLVIGGPSYGPNADTGGVVRVSGATPITLEGSDASALQYRVTEEGENLPPDWTFDLAAPLEISLAGQSDGDVVMQYAPVSSDDIVAERRHEVVQLDTTPPTLDLPDPITVYATETAGAYVTYAASATDNFPGPVDFSCDHVSGSLFPNGKNAPLTTVVTCTATDAVENTATGSFDVTVVSPFGYIPDFVVLGRDWASIGNDAIVETGNVGAYDASAGVPNQAGFEILADPGASFLNGSQIAAHSDRLEAGASAGDVFYVDQVVLGNGAVATEKLGYVPLFYDMPAVPAFSAGGADVALSEGETLAAGTYGDLSIKPNMTAVLSGGDYFVTSLDLKHGARLLAAAPTTIHVTGRVQLKSEATLMPLSGSGIGARDVVLYALGGDGPPSNPATAIRFGSMSVLGVNAYAPNGTLAIETGAVATGAFVGLRVEVSPGVTLNEDSVFLCP